MLVNSVEAGDEIIVDITHAFRAIPMLAVVMINYLQMVKNVTFIGLYYGAVESLGKIKDVEGMNIKDRTAPIIDLSSFIYLLQFSGAVHNFMQYGDAEEISNFAINTVKPVLIETKGSDEISQRIRKVAEDLRAMTQNFAYCRGKDIIKFDYTTLYSNIQALKDSFDEKRLPLKPLQPLLDNILKKLEMFKDYGKNEDARKGILAAKWCLDHNLIQQSITILQESIVTLICMNHKMNYLDLKNRELIGKAYREINMKHKKNSDANREEINFNSLLSDQLIISLAKEFDKLTKLRNDINHANFRDEEKSSEKIRKEITEIHKRVMDEVEKLK